MIRRRKSTPQGQEVAKGVTRPPLVTEQQQTPPPVNPVRTETPEPRSYGEQLRRQSDALRKQVRDLLDANAELWDAIRTRDGRIVGLSGDNYRLAEGNKTLAARVTALEAEVGQRKETARNLALAAEEVDRRHRAAVGRLEGMLDVLRAQMAAAGRPESTDPEPTSPLPPSLTPPEWAREQDRRVMGRLYGAAWADVLTNGGQCPGPDLQRVSDDLLATGWMGRSSADAGDES